jgi:hypothetical protein
MRCANTHTIREKRKKGQAIWFEAFCNLHPASFVAASYLRGERRCLLDAACNGMEGWGTLIRSVRVVLDKYGRRGWSREKRRGGSASTTPRGLGLLLTRISYTMRARREGYDDKRKVRREGDGKIITTGRAYNSKVNSRR